MMLTHRAQIAEDDGGPIMFKWHVKRGILSKRMSGMELATFVITHMPAILGMGLLAHHPRVEAEFHAMLVKLATSPASVIDRLLGWIRVEWHEQEDDIIHMSLFDTTEQQGGPRIFL
jgi:hypothetical protein